MSLPEIKFEISATSVSWYGALLATIGFILSIFNYLRDRSKIKMYWKKNMKAATSAEAWGFKKDKDYIIIDVINKGRRDVNIGIIACMLLNGEGIILNNSLKAGPQTIKEGSRKSYPLEQDTVNFSNIAEFIAIGETRKLYSCRVAPFKKYFIYKLKGFFRIYNRQNKLAQSKEMEKIRKGH